MEGYDGVNAPMATTETFKREKYKKRPSQVMLRIILKDKNTIKYMQIFDILTLSFIFYTTGYGETKKLFAMLMLDVFVMMGLSIIWTCYHLLLRKYVLEMTIFDCFDALIYK